MGALLRRIARTCILLMAAVILALGLAGSWCAFAQSPKAAPAAEKPAASGTTATEHLTRAAEAANPAINTKDIVNRLNQELGIDLQATIENHRTDDYLALPINLSLKFAVLILAVPLIMLQWGYAWPDI